MSDLVRKGHCTTEALVTARKVHVCAWCDGRIDVGELHIIATEFPGGEAGYADYAGRPVRMRVHAKPPCYHGPTEPMRDDADAILGGDDA